MPIIYQTPSSPPHIKFMSYHLLASQNLSAMSFIITISLIGIKKNLREVVYLRSHYIQETAGIETFCVPILAYVLLK